MTSQSRLIGLDPQVATLAVSLVASAARRGWRIMITQGLRTYAQQNALYAKGRTTPGEPCHHKYKPHVRPVGECDEHPLGARVTNVRNGGSWHTIARAFDVAFVDENGKPSWDVNAWPWEELGALGETLGLTWGFRVWGFDLPHFHVTRGQTLAEARDEFEAGSVPPGA